MASRNGKQDSTTAQGKREGILVLGTEQAETAVIACSP